MDVSVKQPGLFARLFGGRRAAAPPEAETTPTPSPTEPIPPPAGDTSIAWFRLATCQGRVVALRGTPARLAMAATLDPAHAILAAVPAAMPHICVLLAPDGRPFHIHEDTQTGIAASALILQSDRPGVVRLKYPLAGPAFLIAMHTAESHEPDIRFDGAGTTIDVAFAMIALPKTDVPASALAIGTEIGKAASEQLRATALLSRLSRGTLRPDLAEPLIRVMPRDELAELARLLLEQPRNLALLGRAMPQSIWLTHHLPELLRWQRARDPTVPDALRHSPPIEAEALHPVKGAGQMPTGLALHSLARRHVLPRRTACVLATAKNEGVYLLDWIAYHLSIGFEHIFLYTNNNTDGSDALLDALHLAGAITWIRNERGERLGAQEKAYAHALTILPHILDYRWTAVIDLDEYIGFDTPMFTDITDFIGFQEAQSVDAIALCWQLFAASPGETWTPQFTPARLTQREIDADKHVKTIFRPRLFCWSRPHDPMPTLGAAFEYRNQEGGLHHHAGVPDRPAAFAENPSAVQAWVNHYLVRTTDELLWKWHRGRANWLDLSQRSWFLEFLSKNFFELARPERLISETRLLDCARRHPAQRARLLTYPGVAESQSHIEARFTEEIARIRHDFLANPPAEPGEYTQKLIHVLSGTKP